MSTTAKPTADRAIFVLEFRPEPGCVDPVKALRTLLKLALRRLDLRCISAHESTETQP